MQISQYIVIKKSAPYRYSSRMTKSSPALDSNEVAVKVSIELPDEVFTKPAFSASLVVPKESVSSKVIDVEVLSNVEEIIKQNTGFEVKLEVVNPKEEK